MTDPLRTRSGPTAVPDRFRDQLAEALERISVNVSGLPTRFLTADLGTVIDALLPVIATEVDALRGPAPADDTAAAVERVRALADELNKLSNEHYDAYLHGDPSDTRRGSAYTEGFCVGYDSAAARIRAALDGFPVTDPLRTRPGPTAVPDRFRDQPAEVRPLADQFAKALREHADDCMCDRWVVHHSQVLAVIAAPVIAAEVDARVQTAANQRAAEYRDGLLSRLENEVDRLREMTRRLAAALGQSADGTGQP